MTHVEINPAAHQLVKYELKAPKIMIKNIQAKSILFMDLTAL